MRKRLIMALILPLFMILFILPFPVSANGPVPSPWYSIEIVNPPEEMAYVDLLIYLPTDDPMYVELNTELLPDGFAENAEIITYCENNYCSYTFHYNNALSVIDPNAQSIVTFFADDMRNDARFSHADDIAQRGDIRLAILDANGNILKVSPLLPQNSNKFLAYSLGSFRYDVQKDHWEVDAAISSWGFILYLIISVAGVMLTCFLETTISCLFRMDKDERRIVLLTNLVSQITMRIAFMVFYSYVFWKYAYAVIVLELAVYVAEYLVYCRTMPQMTWKRRVAFVICANTASLLLGSIFNYAYF